MKILLLSPNQINRYNWGHQRFRNDLSLMNDVIYYGQGYPNYNPDLCVKEILKHYGRVDIILTFGLRYTLPFKGLGDITNVPKVHILVDYFPPHPAGYRGSWDRQHKFIEERKFDLFFARQRRQIDDLKNNGIQTKAHWLPFSVDTSIYKNLNLPKKYDVLTSSTCRNDVYPNRNKINNLIQKMGLKFISGRIIHQSYINAINQSKVCIISVNIFGSPNMKFSEFTACGSFVLADKPEDFDELGFRDNEHLVLYSGLQDLENKIKYYLANEKERELIAKGGMEFSRENLNNVKSVEKFTQIVKKEFGI